MIYLIGTGCGVGSLTKEAADAINGAAALIGAERLLRMYPGDVNKTAAVRKEDILNAVKACITDDPSGSICILLSGDSGFYSGARSLLPLLEEYDVRVLPGISSLQVLAARCGQPWQDWHLCSAHGTDCDAVKEVCRGVPVFFLTGGKLGPAQLCRQLAEAGLSDLPVTIGEDLGTENEKIVSGKAGDFTDTEFAVLSVMLAEPAPRPYRRTPGLPDETFERIRSVPMTKQYVRAAVLAALALKEDDVCWDVGAGTGSVAIEMALQAGKVFGVERNAEAVELARKNREMMGAWNLQLSEGGAPDSLRDLPAPDAVFVGGSGGKLREILLLVKEKNVQARVCVSAVTVETLSEACSVLDELGYQTDIIQVGISQSRKAAGLHMMTAQNTIWLIKGERQ